MLTWKIFPIAEAIRHYKLNASGGYDEWSKVPRAPDYFLHVPSMDFNVTGHDEVRSHFRLADRYWRPARASQYRYGGSVTCYLHITDKEGAVPNDVQGRVSEIWALWYKAPTDDKDRGGRRQDWVTRKPQRPVRMV